MSILKFFKRYKETPLERFKRLLKEYGIEDDFSKEMSCYYCKNSKISIGWSYCDVGNGHINSKGICDLFEHQRTEQLCNKIKNNYKEGQNE